MIFLVLGAATLLVLMSALGMFSRTHIETIKQLGVWVVAIGGLVMAALLFLTGRGTVAIAALAMLGPLIWSWKTTPPSARGASGARNPPQTGGMTTADAYGVLGLQPGASEADIRAAHRRLMRAAHPDSGGSDWLAARVNQARDILLG